MIKSNLSFAQQKDKLTNDKTEQIKKLIPESIKLLKMVKIGNFQFQFYNFTKKIFCLQFHRFTRKKNIYNFAEFYLFFSYEEIFRN